MNGKENPQRDKERVERGEDARAFGVGGQVVERAPDPGDDDAPQRDVERDQSLPEDAHPSRSKR